jgi:hypothetical protein
LNAAALSGLESYLIGSPKPALRLPWAIVSQAFSLFESGPSHVGCPFDSRSLTIHHFPPRLQKKLIGPGEIRPFRQLG